MAKYRALAVSTSYWKPGEDLPLQALIKALEGRVHDGDYVVVSEKALPPQQVK
jgi:F420-0:gamma-glutamyl ligase-like protein